ncbi:hypothetical protein CC80DRAFT_532137 [Byssothecium circinans]|uniref:Nephrocystin 3-like N-terminal domain-containing protein n=1 Tax=Byssothecium circinans TaxID=147558 RepID=A0A6A5U9Y9_9PLEO|nr:hypothetical protein CC80DRAFT_532137 [Byssothecium circinans]
MAQDISTIIRPRVLTNSAAEFLETRAQQALGTELAGPGNPQYVPVRDEFVAQRSITKVNYHIESANRLKQLESTLTRFAEKIKDKGLDKKLDVVLKDPKSYTMEDVLVIAGKIETQHRDAENVKNAMGVIRKCFRRAGDHHAQLGSLLKFVPNDTYGSVISGGFTMILGAVGRAEKLRTDIYECLAEIPLKLKAVQDLAEVYYQSAGLQMRADSVFVSIFMVLERIVNELSKNMAKKGMSLVFKGDRHSFDVTESIADLEKRLKEFRTQVDICSQQKLGRVDVKATRSMIAAENTEMMVAETNIGISGIHERLDRFDKFEQRWMESQRVQEARFQEGLLENGKAQDIEVVRQETLHTNVFNTMYVFLTGNPSFDPRTGILDQDRAARLQKELVFPMDPRNPKSTIAKSNRKLVKNWSAHLRTAYDAAYEDIQEGLQGLRGISTSERDKVQWILTSDEIHHWLRTASSAVLYVEQETCPDTTMNPVTFTTAFLVKLLKKQDYPLLSCFCGLRANSSMDESTSGPVALLSSLFVQLLKQLQKKRPEINLTPAMGVDSRIAHTLDKRGYMDSIKRLVDSLKDRDCVFIMLDMVIDLTGSTSHNDEVLKFILDLSKDTQRVVKVMATGRISESVLRNITHEVLFLPDVVDTGSHDIDPVYFEEDTLDSIEYFDKQELENQTGSDNDDESVSESGDYDW